MANKKRSKKSIPSFDVHRTDVSVSLFYSEVLDRYDLCILGSGTEDSVVIRVVSGSASKILPFLSRNPKN